MIIKKITTRPFAGMANYSISFDSSMNVVMGPNEAGKSTIQKALWFALFIPTNLKPKEFQKYKSVMLPAHNGDHAEVELVFEVHAQAYNLKKRWGAAHEAMLQMPDGSLLRSEDGVAQKMVQLAGLNKATYRNVLFTFQSQLGQTVTTFKESAEAQQDLSNVLRNAIVAQGGVNIDYFKHELNEIIEGYELNWDVQLGRPMNGKDIDNPYKRDIGKILGSYYKYRSLEQQFKKAQGYEKRMDSLITSTESIALTLKGTEEFLQENAKALTDAKEMGKISHEIDKAVFTRDSLRAVLKKWPELKARYKFEEENIKRLTGDIARLLKEKDAALIRQATTLLLDKHKQAAAKIEELEKATNKLKELPVVTDTIREKALLLEKQMQAIKIELAAQKLHVELQANIPFEGTLKAGGEAAKKIYVQPSQCMMEEVVGCFSISTAALQISVKSCAIDADTLEEDLDKLNEEFTQILSSSGVKTVADLVACAKQYKQAQETIAGLNKELQAILNGSTFEDLDSKVSQINNLPQTRSLKDVQHELDRCNADMGGARKSLVEIQDSLKEYEHEYSSQDQLIEQGVANKQKLEALLQMQKQITALPEGYAKPEEFIAEYEKMEKLQKELRQQHTQLVVNRKELEKEEPQSSSSELMADLELAKAEHKRVMDEYKAYFVIREELSTILASIHSQTFNPLYQRTKAYLSELTCAKYTEIGMEETLPVSIGSNGAALATELLSKGTTDCLALALRLAMAEHYLAGQKGFLILDDPLVDMDAQRQQAAAEALTKYAQSRQIIVFTCHTANADMLKGNTIKI